MAPQTSSKSDYPSKKRKKYRGRRHCPLINYWKQRRAKENAAKIEALNSSDISLHTQPLDIVSHPEVNSAGSDKKSSVALCPPGGFYCCVAGCRNSKENKAMSYRQRVRYYSFPTRPSEMQRRTEWIDFVNRKNLDDSDWEPDMYSRICADHFVNGRKRDFKNSRSYNPTLYELSSSVDTHKVERDARSTTIAQRVGLSQKAQETETNQDVIVDSITIADDLLRIVQRFLMGTVNITPHTVQGEENVWEIEGPDENLMVALHYKNVEFAGEQETDLIQIKREINDDFTTDNQPKAMQATNLGGISTSVAESDVKCSMVCPELNMQSSEVCTSQSNMKVEAIEHYPKNLQCCISETDKMTVVNDLHRTIQHILVCTENISFRMLYDKVNVGEIHGPVENLTIKLHYRRACNQIDNKERIQIKQEIVDDFLTDTSCDNQTDFREIDDLPVAVKLEGCEMYTNVHDEMFVIEEGGVVNELHDRKSHHESALQNLNIVNLNSNLGIDRPQIQHPEKTEERKQNGENKGDSTGSFRICYRAGKMYHFCLHCDKLYYGLRYMRIHLQLIHGESPYDCVFCKTNFNHLVRLKRHMYNSHGIGKKPRECSDCGRKFFSPSAFRQHISRYLHNYNCTNCDMKFVTRGSLDQHQYHVHGIGNMLQCPCCKKLFFLDNLIIHLTNCRVWLATSYQCFKCKEKFSDIGHMLRHKYNAHGIGKIPYQCFHCSKKFFCLDYMKMHMRIHDNDSHGLTKCSRCDLTFTSSIHLTRHEYTIHGIGEIPFQCSLCDRKFFSEDTLKLHSQVHDYKKCFKCNMSFAEIAPLRQHLRDVHNVDKFPFRCSQCYEEFSSRAFFMRHCQIYNMEWSLPCSFCSMKFNDSDLLEQHKRVHHHSKQNSRSLKKFSSMKHYRVNGEATHPCSTCGEKFWNLATLEKHQHAHDKEKLLPPEMVST